MAARQPSECVNDHEADRPVPKEPSRIWTKAMKVLVTGGAGYIGSHAVLALREAGHSPVVLDNLSTGSRDAVPHGVPLEIGDLADVEFIERTIAQHAIDAIMHFAAKCIVPESVEKPLYYYRNNVVSSLGLIEACTRR